MADYDFEAIAADGALQKGRITATDSHAAVREIEARDLIVVRVAPAAEQVRRFGRSGLFSRSVSQADITILLSDLAALVQSRLRIDEALKLMLQEVEFGNSRQLLTDIHRRLENGESLSQAMQAQGNLFEQVEIEMIRLAESTGDLGVTLGQIAEDRELRAGVVARISASLRYPAFLLLGALTIMVFFLIYVLPQFEPVLATLNRGDDSLGYIFAVSRLIRDNSDLIMVLALVAILAAWIASRSARLRSLLRRALFRLPVAGTIAKTFRDGRICTLIAQTQRAGVDLPTALSVIGLAVDGPAETKISRDAVAGLRRGMKLADVLDENANLQDLALRMIRLGEQSSQIEALAARAGILYEARAQRHLQRVLAIVGPVVLVLISTVIGGLIVVIMNALLSINDMVGL
ncbi:hypothetical protein CSC94_18485 [Zhengella mangrovi]|uniref:Type II secretion system protein GspF domain-containing protein n=1 Tax=Zhengella mangrovi TaxID=1982044 RepID=A0A2G1QJF5_9HYPH|nr:type II secretion system F family protein [Zhengella mangrovi]PHP65581.1 hypothetical protein CSC94_18485 [Zhengella mangrovi]